MQGDVYVEYFYPGKIPAYKQFDSRRRGAWRNQMQAVRWGDTMALRYDIHQVNDSFEIYNTKKDPKESQNIYNNDLQKQLIERFTQLRLPDSSAPRPYDQEPIAPVVPPNNLKQGLRASFFQGHFDWIPVVDGLISKQNSITKTFDKEFKNGLEGIIAYEGYLKVPADGEYTFYLKSSRKALFKIFNLNILDADYGYLPNTEIKKTVRLKRGFYPFKFYSQNGLNTKVSLQWHRDGLDKEIIPLQYFYFLKKK